MFVRQTRKQSAYLHHSIEEAIGIGDFGRRFVVAFSRFGRVCQEFDESYHGGDQGPSQQQADKATQKILERHQYYPLESSTI